MKDKRILITGAYGFLGRFVMDELESRGYWSYYTAGHKGYDLTNPIAADALLQYHQPNIVIHLAAKCGGIGANMDKPAEFFTDNILMNTNMVEASYKHNIEKFIGIGSVCSYPKHCPVPFKEEDLWEGFPESTNAAYGIAKKALMIQLQTYRQQYGFNGIYLIPVNMYGENDHFDLRTSHVIPALIRKIYEAKKSGQKQIECWGTGEASREFFYAGDCARGIIDAMEKYDGGEPVNLGTGKEIKIKDLVNLIAKLSNWDGEIVWRSEMPDGQPRRMLDISKAEKLFGFRATTSLEEGLIKTIRYYEGL